MHHTSISIVILGKHIATMLRHNPYSLLRSTARTNLVERSYPQFFLILLDFDFILFVIYYYYYLLLLLLLLFLVSFPRVPLCFSFPLSNFEPP